MPYSPTDSPTMVTRKPVGSGGRSFSASSASGLPSNSPPSLARADGVPGTPIVTAPTPTSATASLHSGIPVLPNAPPPPPPPPLPSSPHAQSSMKSSDAPKTTSHAPVRPPEPLTDSEDEWEKTDSEDEWDMADNEAKITTEPKSTSPPEVPAALRVSRPSSRPTDHPVTEVPPALRIGTPSAVSHVSSESLVNGEDNNPWKSSTTPLPRNPSENNPFIRPQNTGEALFGSQNPSEIWGNGPTPPPGALAAQPVSHIAELPAVNSPIEGSGNTPVYEMPMRARYPASQHPFPSDDQNEEKEVVNGKGKTVDSYDPYKHMSVFDTLVSSTEPRPVLNPTSSTHEAWQSQQHSISEGKQKDQSLLDLPPLEHSASPEEQAPPKPPRPAVDTARFGGSSASPASPGTVMKTQRNQTYQIKKIRWFDDRVHELRMSPILIQNANGPCPLLALVNALTLSTPNGLKTGLVETLRSREQVSLGLLLDAVFEELMSRGRGDGAQELPDVGELYSFLIALHTGMNVNPQFTVDPDLPRHGQSGVFERTKEMRFYSTFNIPLMHGWLPEQDSEEYAAFDRSAKTYEDAQNIQFYEEELETKLGSTGLTTEEQHLFEDLINIKQFLDTWPTQLTEYGLRSIKDSLRPGQFAILFRNDHFSTIYKEPKSNSLVTVVTDAGYSSHEEIVWESLVDINGMRTEHFSGDFRPVSHSQTSDNGLSGPRDSSLASRPVQGLLDADQGWTQVQGKNNKKRGKSASTTLQQTGIIGSSSSSLAHAETAPIREGRSRSEQEDADLALALQLQEEEEDRQRRGDSDRRNRQLSAQVLDHGTNTPTPVSRPPVPARRGPPQNFTTNRPAAAAGEEAPPPSYEDASKDRRFVPPQDHPSSPYAPVSSAQTRQQSAYMQNASSSGGAGRGGNAMGYGGPPNVGARRPSRPGQQLPGDSPLIDRIPDRMGGRRSSGMAPVGLGGNREEKCVVM